MTTLSAEEIAAAVAEAHRWGRTVAIHCQSFDAAKFALRAGADTIEHGTRLDTKRSHFLQNRARPGADLVHPVQRS
jgi:imidazolonepropionase-like amidohydrolase